MDKMERATRGIEATELLQLRNECLRCVCLLVVNVNLVLVLKVTVLNLAPTALVQSLASACKVHTKVKQV